MVYPAIYPRWCICPLVPLLGTPPGTLLVSLLGILPGIPPMVLSVYNPPMVLSVYNQPMVPVMLYPPMVPVMLYPPMVLSVVHPLMGLSVVHPLMVPALLPIKAAQRRPRGGPEAGGGERE